MNKQINNNMNKWFLNNNQQKKELLINKLIFKAQGKIFRSKIVMKNQK